MIVDNLLICRFIGSLVLTAITLVIRRQSPRLKRTDYLPVASQIFIQTLMNLVFFMAVTRIPIGTASCCSR